MIVSILQLMGFPMGKPVHSRASENSGGPGSTGLSKAHEARKVEDDVEKPSFTGKVAGQAHAEAQSARKTDVKAKVGKPAKAAKVQSQAKKPTAKPAAKPALKAGVKTAVKPKASAAIVKNPVAKPSVKPAAKPAAKSGKPGKPGKPGKAAAPKVAAKKAVAKLVVTAVKPAAVKTKNQKPTPKVAAKSVNLVIPKKAKQEPAKLATPPKPSAKPASKAATPVAKAPVGALAKTPAAAPVVAALAPVPAKAGRPSSRLAQLTVPSMAQSVASTAAKSSYTQTTALPLIAPPLASAHKKDPKLANNWKSKPAEQMSDAELMAMPDAEYMNEKQMAVFRLKLAILKQDILNSAGETTEHLREDTVVVPDPADRATIEEEHALELRTRDRERKLLKKIEQSINRIDAGDYGYCDETGEPIGVGRLLARPTATLSLEAQQRRELKQKMFGD